MHLSTTGRRRKQRGVAHGGLDVVSDEDQVEPGAHLAAADEAVRRDEAVVNRVATRQGQLAHLRQEAAGSRRHHRPIRLHHPDGRLRLEDRRARAHVEARRVQRGADGRSRLEPSARRRRKHDVDRLGRPDLARGCGLDPAPPREILARERRGVVAARHEVAAGADHAEVHVLAAEAEVRRQRAPQSGRASQRPSRRADLDDDLGRLDLLQLLLLRRRRRHGACGGAHA